MSTAKVNTNDARQEFADLVNRAAYAKERIRITRRGRDIAAIVPIEDMEQLEQLEDEADIRAIRARRNEPDEPIRPLSEYLAERAPKRAKARKRKG